MLNGDEADAKRKPAIGTSETGEKAMRATETLMNEHRVIEQVLACLEKMADRCILEGELDAESTRSAMDFLQNFAERCHQGKEERHLFAKLEAEGFGYSN